MWKKSRWLIELVIIICIFRMVFQGILFIRSNYYNSLIEGFLLNIFAYIAFLFFAIYSLIVTNKKNNQTITDLFGIRFLFKDIWIVLVIFILGKFFYNLIIKIEFIHFFGMSSLPRVSSLTSFQSWAMICLIVLFIPIVVFSEELYFRGYLFNIQHLHFKNYTWVINGFSWSIYHVFTPTNFLALLPTCLMYSYIYQKRRNIWITIAIHLLNNIIAYYPIIKAYVPR